MLDHKEALKSLVIGVRDPGEVSVRETNFGYIIRSERGGGHAELRERIVKFALVAVWISVAGVWLLPLGGGSVALKAVYSVVVLALAYLGLILSRNGRSGFELHVDTSRRELRSAVLTVRGESWIRSSARFGEVLAPLLRRSRSGDGPRSLCLRIAGEDDVMPVAVADEDTLMAIHDRLMRDLRPIEERLPGFKLNSAARKRARQKVFPALGPDEVGA